MRISATLQSATQHFHYPAIILLDACLVKPRVTHAPNNTKVNRPFRFGFCLQLGTGGTDITPKFVT